MNLPLHPASDLLFAVEPESRWMGVRALGKAGVHLDLLEQVAEQDAEPLVGISAAFWLAMNGRHVWLDHLASLASELADRGLADFAARMHRIACSFDGELAADC